MRSKISAFKLFYDFVGRPFEKVRFQAPFWTSTTILNADNPSNQLKFVRDLNRTLVMNATKLSCGGVDLCLAPALELIDYIHRGLSGGQRDAGRLRPRSAVNSFPRFAPFSEAAGLGKTPSM